MLEQGLTAAGGDGRVRTPIVEQYAAIKTRQEEIGTAEREPASPPPSSGGTSSDYAIWVLHAGRVSFLSWLSSRDDAMLNPAAEAAMRFGNCETAAALLEHVPALREKSRRAEAGVADIRRPYRGVPLLRWRDEQRLSTPQDSHHRSDKFGTNETALPGA